VEVQPCWKYDVHCSAITGRMCYIIVPKNYVTPHFRLK
jgi:hypothetical protein